MRQGFVGNDDLRGIFIDDEATVAQGPSRVGNLHPIDVVPIVPVR